MTTPVSLGLLKHRISIHINVKIDVNNLTLALTSLAHQQIFLHKAASVCLITITNTSQRHLQDLLAFPKIFQDVIRLFSSKVCSSTLLVLILVKLVLRFQRLFLWFKTFLHHSVNCKCYKGLALSCGYNFCKSFIGFIPSYARKKPVFLAYSCLL